MTPPAPPVPEAGSLPNIAVRQRLVLSWLALTWERLWIRLWLPATGLLLFFAAGMTDVLSLLPDLAHLLIVIAAFVAIGFESWRRLRTFALPTRHEARARLETHSPVTHRPLTTVEDSLVQGSGTLQKLLWHMHQRRAHDHLKRLRAILPAPGVATRDPFAARAVVILLLVVALAGGWGEVANRMWRTMVPALGRAAGASSIKVWITPPAYTNRSPLYLEIPPAEGTTPPSVLEIPAGSKALAVVTGAKRDVVLTMGETSVSLDRMGDESQRGETPLTPAKRLELFQAGRLLAGWDVDWIPDNSPTIAFAAPPAEAPRWRLKLEYHAADDYGVQEVKAHMTRADVQGEGEESEFAVTVPPFAPKTVAMASVSDLASHPWAGMKVKVRLVATDQAGQTGVSETMAGVLPERQFVHPISKELARHRKALMADPPSAADPALKGVGEILQKPDAFGGDPLVHLALSTAKYRLSYEPPATAARTAPELMWHAAVRIEDGNIAAAEQRMKDAEKALQEALERGASQEEIERLIDELQQAVADYAKATADKNKDSAFANAANSAAQDAADMLEQMKQMSELGSEEAMKQALAELQEKLQDMRQQSGSDASNNADVKAAQKLMQQMRDLAKEQAKQLDENFQHARQQAEREAREQERNQGRRGPPEKHPGQSQRDAQEEAQRRAEQAAGNQAASAQEAIRKQLADMMKQLEKMTGKSPETLGEAEQSMADARDSLKVASFKTGVEGQSKALSKLQQGLEESSSELMQSLFERGLGGLVQLPGATRLHFGQGQRTGRANSEDVDVPMGPDPEGMAQRVRAILEEIRERAADRTRSAEEQDYLRRLMKQF